MAVYEYTARDATGRVLAGAIEADNALTVLEEQTTHKKLREVIGQIRADIEAGSTLSTALAKHPQIFSGLYVNMVRAGEAGGVLDEVLMRLATFLEKELALRQKVRSSTTYPILLACAALGAL